MGNILVYGEHAHGKLPKATAVAISAANEISAKHGGGDVILTGSSVVQQVGRTIDTDGGDIDIRSGTISQNGFPIVWERQPLDPDIDPLTSAPTIDIAGTIDTSN